jgi:hypothetical protein
MPPASSGGTWSAKKESLTVTQPVMKIQSLKPVDSSQSAKTAARSKTDRPRADSS